MAVYSDLQSFNQLYTEYYAGFLRFANSYIRDMAVAEDVVSDSFIAYWENKNNLPSDSNTPAYILTTIKNKCLNHLQQKELQGRTLAKLQDHAHWELDLRISTLEACDPEKLFSDEIQKIVDTTLASLPQKTIEVFTLSRYKNKTHKEIASLLDITTKGVEFHITKALTKLRANLKDYMICVLLFFFL